MLKRPSRLRAFNIWLMAPLWGVAVFLVIFMGAMAPKATAATTSSNLNFQARLLGSNGTIVPDGTYNIDFKLYNADSTTGSVGTCSGACLWEETRQNSNSQGVQVINGYFSVNLGSVTSFPAINWDQQLWLTMNIGGTGSGASPTYDGEMQNSGHSIALTALPYSFVAGQLAKTSGANRGTLSFNTVANNPAITLPDASGTVCLQSATACGFELTSGTDFIRNQTSLQTADFNISGTGVIGTALQASLVQTADSSAGNTSAITLRSGNQTGSSLSSGNVTIKSGDAGSGTNSSSGNVTIDVGSKSGSGTTGTITVGGSNASGITIGNITTTSSETFDASTINIGNSTAAHTINIGHSGTSSQTINIGSTSSGSGVAITAGSAGISLGANTSFSSNVDVTGSIALKKTTDFSSTANPLNNVNFGNASLVRLTGASTQIITGIANGRDGYILTIVNAAGQAATLKNNDTVDSSAGNVIITGTGGDYSLLAGASLQLVYDAGDSVWRAESAITAINTIGTYSSTNHYANGAQISGTTLTLGSADASNPGLIDTSSQTFAGNKTFTGTLTVAPTTNISSVVIKQTSAASPSNDIFSVQGTNGTSNFIQVTSTAANQGAVTIQSFGASNALTLQSANGTVSLGTSTGLSANGALTVSSGGTSDLTVDSLSGILKIGSNTSNILFTTNGTALIDAASTKTLALGTSNNAHQTTLGSTNASATTTVQGGGGVTLNGNTSVSSGKTFGVTDGASSLTNSTGVALTVNNSTGSNSIAVFQDNGNAVATIADNGQITFKNAGDTTNAFQIQNNSSSALLNVNTTDGYVINNGVTDLNNVIQNPGFEASGSGDGTGWFTPGTGQTITNDGNAHTGNYALKVTGNSATHAIQTKYFAVKPGDIIYVEAYVKNLAGANGDAGIYVEYSDKDKGNATFTTMDAGLPGTSYILKSNTLTIPANKYYIRLAASVRSSSTSGTFYFDDFYLKKVNESASLLLTGVSSTAFQVQNSSGATIFGVDSSTSKIFSSIADGASAVGFIFNTPSYTTIGAKLFSIQNNSAEKFYVDKDGNINASGSVTAGSGISAGGDITTTGNMNIGSGKVYKVNNTQISSADLSNNSDLAKLAGTGPQIFSGNNKFTGTALVQNNNSAGFQVQHSTNAVFTVDTSGDKVILGAASNITGSIQFQGSGGAGTLTLAGPTTPDAGNFTLSIPAITANANICTDNSICTNYASSSSVTTGLAGKLNKNAIDTSAASVTALQGNLYVFTNNSNNIASGILKIDNGNNTGNGLTVTGSANDGGGNAFIVINNTNATPTGAMLDIQANGVSKFDVDAAGNVTASGNISIASGKQYQINGTQISTSALSDGNVIAKTNANNTFSGNNTFSSASNSFTGDGAGLTNLNATNVASGTLNDLRLSSNVALLSRTGQIFTGDNTFAPTSANAGTLIKQTSGTATSGSVLDVQTATTGAHFLQITNAAAEEGAVTLQSVGATRDLTIGSGSGTLKITAATNTIQHSNSSLTIDINNNTASTLFVTNAQSGVAASLDVEGGINIGASQLYKIGGTQIDSTALSNNSDLAKRGSSNTFTATNTIAVTSGTAFQVQNGANASVLVVDTSARQLKVMENSGSTNYSLIYYDTATSTANYTASAGTVAVGTGSGAITVTAGSGSAVNITGNAASTWKTTAGTLTLQSGTGSSDFLILNSGGSGQVQVNGSAVVKLGAASADPTCTNGAIYYNTTSTTFRGCQGGSWATLGVITPTLQTDYNSSTGSSTPEVKLNAGGTDTTAFDIQDADSTLNGVIFAVRGSNVGGLGISLLNVDTSNNTVNIGTTATSTALLVLGVDTNATFNQGTTSNAASAVNGAMFYSSTDHNFLCGVAGAWITCNGLLYSNTSASSAINTCTNTCAAFSTSNSTTVPANYCTAGRVIRISAKGHYSVTGTPTLALGVYYGTNNTTRGNDTQIGASTPAPAAASGASNQFWALDYTITCFDTTHMMGEGIYTFQNNTTATNSMLVLNVLSTASTAVTTTSANALYIFPTWSASSASNTVTCDQIVITGN